MQEVFKIGTSYLAASGAYDQKARRKKKQAAPHTTGSWRKSPAWTGGGPAGPGSATRRSTQARQDKAAWNEIQTAQGLTSGAQGQALLTMDNQLRGDLTAISQAGNAEAAELAARRQALARDLAAQLGAGPGRKRLRGHGAISAEPGQDSQQAPTEGHGRPLAQAGDFSLYGALYGLTRGANPPPGGALPRQQASPGIPGTVAPSPAPPRRKNRAWGIFLHSPLTFWEKGV